uniref:Uncharacterized protein n=1 Tax=Arundo donax TaxID=35708 RepID=A0A0A9DIX0_ARUDO
MDRSLRRRFGRVT